METISNWLEFFNGKKTIIAAVMLVISAFLEQVVVGQWGVQASWIAQVIGTLDWFGMILGGVGLTHKGVKVVKPGNE